MGCANGKEESQGLVVELCKSATNAMSTMGRKLAPCVLSVMRTLAASTAGSQDEIRRIPRSRPGIFHVDLLKVNMELLLKGPRSPLDRTMAGSIIGYRLQADGAVISSLARDVSDRIKPQLAGHQSDEAPAFMQTA